MKIIIGLGNPSEKYVGTRHNIGFDFLDKLRDAWDFPEWKFSKKFNAEISKGNFEGQEILLSKPQTFMNLSGETAQSLLDFYKLTPDDILIIHDDLDIALGKYKVATDSSAAGHNGAQNIIDRLGTQKFKRIRIGIGEESNGAPVCRLGAHDFVLGKFSAEEKEKIENIFPNALEEIKKQL